MPTMFTFATALAASISLTPAARQLALRLGLIDQPDARKVHLVPTPLMGGLAIYISAILAILLFIHSDGWSQIVGILAGATLLIVVGTLDDRGLLHHQIKLMLGMPLAAVLLLVSGIRATVFSSAAWLPGPDMLWIVADWGLSLIWIVGLTASFSILDHMDGLCAGVAGVAAVFFLIFALVGDQILIATLSAAIAGATLGFLIWNFNPAKIFMGDGGAMFLGFMMAALSLKLRPVSLEGAPSGMIPVLILGAALFDTFLVIVSRTRRGLIPFAAPGKDHTAHRLANLGLKTRGAVLTMYAVGICFGALALSVRGMTAGQAFTLASIVIVLALVAVAALERAPYQRQQKHH